MDKIARSTFNLGNLECVGPLCLEGRKANEAPDVFNLLLSTVIGVMTMIASLWFLFQLITGAYSYISSGGDKNSIERARNKMLNGLLGFIVVIVAIFLLDLIGELFGLPYISNPGKFINEIAP